MQLAITPVGAAASAIEVNEEAIRFYLDTPAVRDGVAIETVRGFLTLTGWAFARCKISHVEIFVDGVSQGHAHYGIRREDLQTAFPEHDALLCGFATMVPPNVLTPGMHQIRMVARSADGHTWDGSFASPCGESDGGAGSLAAEAQGPAI